MWKVVRSGAVIAAGLLTALTLTGCGGGDGGDGGKNGPGNGQDAGKTGRTSGGDGSGNDTGDGPGNGSGSGSGGDSGSDPTNGAGPLEGAWAGKTDGKAVVLSVASGKAVLITEQGACTGQVRDTGRVTLALKCADGSTDRTDGTVESVNGRTLLVSWSAGTKDTLAKTAPGALPSGLPDLPDQ
ncbi:hypothetical protein ACF1A9_17965 [Streptomyces sp. NPDC014872]|uniref:hypothetical protein n=1 Tax=Streptomyces sp. NPDC014872 TaxID=3364926 RepID=UPI0036FC34B6